MHRPKSRHVFASATTTAAPSLPQTERVAELLAEVEAALAQVRELKTTRSA